MCMLIALDYDGTYTEDPLLWQGFIRNAKRSGHQVICVTMRSHLAFMDDVLTQSVEVYCTNLKAKSNFIQDLGIYPDIWIDDNPVWLYEDAP